MGLIRKMDSKGLHKSDLTFRKVLNSVMNQK